METYRRTDKGQPFLSWAIIARNCESTVESTLRSIRERTPQAEIVVIDTMSSDKTPEICQKYADVWIQYKGPRGDWSRDMYAFDDAAAARQFAFEQATGVYRGWIDTDDVLPGPEEAERLLRLNHQWRPAGGGTIHEAAEAPQSLEDILRHVEQAAGGEEFYVWAPYLYHKDKDGRALDWIWRERIVKWQPGKWRWSERAHEVLVPVSGVPIRMELPHLLFVHQKQWNEEDKRYSLVRHYTILKNQVAEPKERTTRRLLYLADFARSLDPNAELAYINAAHEEATTRHDRYRCLWQLGAYYSHRGLFQDALEAFGAAIQVRPDLPDAWVAGAETWWRAEDWQRCAEWAKQASNREVTPESRMNPRSIAIRYPTLAAESLVKVARSQANSGLHEQALVSLRDAMDLAARVRDSDAIGPDIAEAQSRVLAIRNEFLAQKYAMMLSEQVKYLLDNDESEKATRVIQHVPWNLQEHPIVVGLERKLRPVVRHLEDAQAYEAFYRSDAKTTGYIPSPEAGLDPEHCLDRVKSIINWLKINKPRARILEIGPYDGVAAIPILRSLPEVTLVGMDLSKDPIDRLKERAERFGVGQRLMIIDREDLDTWAPKFDVILWLEVIEHVQNPLADLHGFLPLVDHSGVLFVSTPWGSFDAGHPPTENQCGGERGHLGHVRAFTVQDLEISARMSGWKTEEAKRIPHVLSPIGDTLLARLSKNHGSDRNVHFAVAGALWDWNASVVKQRGMGASEECLVYLARELSRGGDGRVNVFGPVPEDEIDDGVAYHKQSAIRRVQDGKIVVSRSPSWGRNVDDWIGKSLPKVLWLQDAYYGDLNADAAAMYERIVVVSEWHKQAMNANHGVPLEKMVVAYNFLLPEHFRTFPAPERKHDHFIYASSPDRGLLPLLRIWPLVRERLPNATLTIAYGWRGCEKLGHGVDPQWVLQYRRARTEFEELRYQPGIEMIDMVDHWRIAREFQRAGVWAYANHQFTETGCLTACKARAGGAVPVVSPIAALNETAKCEQAIFVPIGDEDAYVNALVQATTVGEEERKHMSDEAIEKFSLSAVLPVWKKVLG